jgi:hypothetical protein
MLVFKQWKRISHKQSTRWQHLSRLKARALFFLQKKLLVVWNATTYTWDWLRHLVDDGALLLTLFKVRCSIERTGANYITDKKVLIDQILGDHFSWLEPSKPEGRKPADLFPPVFAHGGIGWTKTLDFGFIRSVLCHCANDVGNAIMHGFLILSQLVKVQVSSLSQRVLYLTTVILFLTMWVSLFWKRGEVWAFWYYTNAVYANGLSFLSCPDLSSITE